jgi:hypothetical protein
MKLIDRIKSDPRIVSLWNEGEDGWWAELAEGYVLQPDETTAIHASSLTELKSALSCIKPTKR